MRAHLLDRLHEIGESFERVVLALHRDQHRVRGAEAVQRQERQRRRAVEQDEIVVGCDLRDRRAHLPQRFGERVLESHLALGQLDQLDLGAGELAIRGHEIEAAGRRGDAHVGDACARRAAPGRRSPASARLSTPAPVVALPCGSRSTSSTRRFIAARLAARLTAVVVLPTPPFWFATAMMRVTLRSPLRAAPCTIRWRCASSPGTRAPASAITCDTPAAAARSPRRDSTPFIAYRRPSGARCRALGLRERREIGEGARDDDVERRRRRVVLDPRRHHLDVREPELDRRLLQERALLVVAVEQHDVPPRPRDRERQSRARRRRCRRRARAGARARGKVRQHGERVEHVMRDHLLRLADRGQVVRAIPFREQREIGDRACRARVLRQRDAAPPRAPRDRRRDRSRRSRGAPRRRFGRIGARARSRASDARAGARSPPA